MENGIGGLCHRPLVVNEKMTVAEPIRSMSSGNEDFKRDASPERPDILAVPSIEQENGSLKRPLSPAKGDFLILEDQDCQNTESRVDHDETSISTSDSEDEEPVSPRTAEEMSQFLHSFKGLSNRFRLIRKIGEGTFSTVYQAEDLKEKSKYTGGEALGSPNKKRQKTNGINKPSRLVALKRIYVTSSPQRILNELELLYSLAGNSSVAPLINAYRYQDQVVAVLPYCEHTDFRDFFKTISYKDMRSYLQSLFSALEFVHEHKIIHRDVKPTNFLYNAKLKRGVLVDFGLAEREDNCQNICACRETSHHRRNLLANARHPLQGYQKNDQRAGKRANRAGTRGFRAPEVLMKCMNQTTQIDMWSAGVVVLTFLSKRFPFFHSSDDIDALIEIASIFGKHKMSACANLHGCSFETTIPTIHDTPFAFEEIIDWVNSRKEEENDDDNKSKRSKEEQQCIDLLYMLMEPDFRKRATAKRALASDFLRVGDSEENANTTNNSSDS